MTNFFKYDRKDDLIPFKLRGDKCPVFRQFLLDEFHLLAVFKFFDPLFVWYVHSSTSEVSGCRKYTLFGARNCGSGKEVGISESGQSSNRIGKVEVGGTRPRGGLRLSRNCSQPAP
jgi:hypothetical protein